MDEDAELDAILQRLGKQFVAEKGRAPKRTIFDVGVSFHEAAKRCAEPRKGPNGEVFTPTSPMITCLAFASELYMKSLLDGSKARGHDLSKLFDRLEPTDREGIAQQYQNLTGRAKPALRQDIDDLAHAFVDWRYIFEKGTSKISVRRLAMLALAIYRHIRIARAEWVVRPHLHESIERELPIDILSQISMGSGIMMRAVAKP